VTLYLKNEVWFPIEFSLQSPPLYIEVKNVGFGIRPLWIQVVAQLSKDCVTLSKLLTTLNLSPLICEMGLRIVCMHVCVVKIE